MIQEFPAPAMPKRAQQPAPRPVGTDSLHARYIAIDTVQRDAYYGSLNNWTVFQRHIPGLRAAICEWKRDQADPRRLCKVIWDATETIPDGYELTHFNVRRNRYFLLNGLFELAKLLCDDFNQQRREALEQL